jgi:hypothetical protein
MQNEFPIHPAVRELAEFYLDVINILDNFEKAISLSEFKEKYRQTAAAIGSDFERQFHQVLLHQALEKLKQERQQRLKDQQRYESESTLQPRQDASGGSMSNKLNIGLFWCTFFQRSFLSRPRQLYDAYRPPSLFVSKMRDAGHEVQFLVCDDLLQIGDLDGTSRMLQDKVQLLYVMTHGEFKNTGYEVYLHMANWVPGTTGIGQNNLAVIVFDTCNLIDTSSIPNWQGVWRTAALGPNVRLLLGFDGPVIIDRSSALRGKAFADNLLNGNTFVDAWISAVYSTVRSNHRKPVAIGIGDDAAGAQAVLNSASISSMPSRRGTGTPSFEKRY